MLYFVCLIAHILCACVVIGYLFYDVFVFRALKHSRDELQFKALKREIIKPSAMLLGCAFMLLLLSGFCLVSFHISGGKGILSGFYTLLKIGISDIFSQRNSFESKLTMKLFAISLLFVFVFISFFCILVLKRLDPMRKFYHHLALAICLVALGFGALLTR